MLKLSLIVIAALACLTTAPQTANAFSPFGDVCRGQDRSESAVCATKKSGDPVSGSDGLIIKITRIVAFAAGAAALILMIVGGINYITAGGDPAKAKSARDTVLNTVIGLIVIVIAQALITFVVRRL